jgi:hypothetical protein
MSKRPSLADTMRLAVQNVPEGLPQQLPRPRAQRNERTTASRFYAATREGKKKVTASILPDIHKSLKTLAVQHETTTEALLTEAISDLLTKYTRHKAA